MGALRDEILAVLERTERPLAPRQVWADIPGRVRGQTPVATTTILKQLVSEGRASAGKNSEGQPIYARKSFDWPAWQKGKEQPDPKPQPKRPARTLPKAPPLGGDALVVTPQPLRDAPIAELEAQLKSPACIAQLDTKCAVLERLAEITADDIAEQLLDIRRDLQQAAGQG